MTVKHLQNLQRQQVAMSAVSDPSVLNKFRAGFSECASEVGRFPGLDPVVKRRLLQHLANCLNQSSRHQEVPQVQVHILPSTQKASEQQVPSSNSIILSNGTGAGLQLVPTRLPNGDIALVLPTSTSHQAQPIDIVPQVPLLVPIMPERTASTASAASSSNYSPSNSPEPTCSMYSQPKPLSLVVRKPEVEEKPWRPW